ncbi:hypothetical protein [Hymenobacter nivis]|uniref:Uncharacterized protein n=1 Tax=Hymenobacter nivis TaxID=1850093 RepID=A0A2Z3GI11_9BACT|nr:hypothetical protein [Hymenobacter nivis]AWM33669.1 hypothetical protein DDQ68_13270 [Hymenobacter nivis]
MPQPLRLRFARFLAPGPWRRVGVLAAVSFGLALALVGYVFGADGHFFSRLAPAFFIFFWLLAVTFLAVVPFVGWATEHWFGRGWAASSPTPAARRPRPTLARESVRSVSSTAAAGRPSKR